MMMISDYPYYLAGTGDIESQAVLVDYCIENNMIGGDTRLYYMFTAVSELSCSGEWDRQHSQQRPSLTDLNISYSGLGAAFLCHSTSGIHNHGLSYCNE